MKSIRVWVARDGDGRLDFYGEKPRLIIMTKESKFNWFSCHREKIIEVIAPGQCREFRLVPVKKVCHGKPAETK